MNKKILMGALILLTVIILLIGVVLFVKYLEKRPEPSPEPEPEPEIQESKVILTYMKEIPLHENILGLNTANVRTPYTINHPEIVRLMNQANIRFLRFPGGTIANVYNWRTGYFDEEVGIEHLENRARSVNRDLNERGEPEKTENFLDLVEKTNINFGLVLNFFTLTSRDMAEWVEGVQESGHEVEFCELGNELYMGEYKAMYPNVDSYIEAAKDYTQSVKEHNPEMKCGIVAERFIPAFQEKMIGAMQWNEKISREDFYDAVIIHLYLAGFNTDESTFPTTIEEIYLKTVMDTELLYPGLKQYLEETFPDKEVWVTEWNLGMEGNVGEDVFESIASGLFTANFLKALFENPQVTMAHYHRLDGIIFAQGEDAQSLQKPFIVAPAYYAFKLYGHAIKGCDKVFIVNVKGTKDFEDAGGRSIPDIGAIGFTGNGKKALVIINRWDQEYELDLEDIVSSKDLVIMERFFGNTIDSKDITYEEPQNIALSDIRIKPFSVTLLEF